MPSRSTSVLVVLVGALLAAGCSHHPSPTASGPRRVVRDGMGREVSLPLTVERIVSLAPSSTEIVCALGLEQRLVGIDRYSDWPPRVRDLPHVGADVDPSLERIVALRPDVVLTATSANTQATVATLERLGLRVYVSHADTLPEILSDMRGIGAALGIPQNGESLARQTAAHLDETRAKYASLPSVKVAVIVWPDPLMVATRHSHVDELLRAAGGVNIVDDTDVPFPHYSLERLVERAPDVLVVGSHSDGGSPPLDALERLKTIPAVRDHRIFVVDGDLLFRPGPRIADGAALLGDVLHRPPRQ